MAGVALHATAPSERDFPIPGTAGAVVVVPAPGAGPGFWAGAPSAALAADGTVVIAYRLRSPDDRGARPGAAGAAAAPGGAGPPAPPAGAGGAVAGPVRGAVCAVLHGPVLSPR